MPAWRFGMVLQHRSTKEVVLYIGKGDNWSKFRGMRINGHRSSQSQGAIAQFPTNGWAVVEDAMPAEGGPVVRPRSAGAPGYGSLTTEDMQALLNGSTRSALERMAEIIEADAKAQVPVRPVRLNRVDS